MWNASMPLLSLVAAPLVALLGIVHAFSVLMVSALALSSAATYLLLRRWVHSWPACWIGGLLFGFSSYSIAEGTAGRLNLVFLALLPLMVLVLDHLLRDAAPRAVMLGCLLGLLAAAQLLISEEQLVIFALLAAGGLLVGAVSRPAVLKTRLPVLAIAAGCACVVFGVLVAYPLVVQFLGPDRLTGPTQSRAQLDAFSGDLASLVLPGPNQLLAPAISAKTAIHFAAGSPSEVTEFVGIPLAVFLAVGTWLRRREPLVQMMAAVSFVSFVLTLGPHLIIANQATSIKLPYDVLAHLPVVSNIMPSRLAIGMWFGIAVLVAVILDAWLERMGASAVSSGEHSHRSRRDLMTRAVRAAVAPAVAILILVPLVPNWPYAETPAAVPDFFTSTADQMISPGSLVLTYPYPITAMAQPMLWQADTDMRFRLVGGYLIAPGPTGAGTFFADANPWLYCLLTIDQNGTVSSSLCNSATLGQSLAGLGVTTILADEAAPNAATAAALITSVVGREPRTIGGVWVWTCTPAVGQSTCPWT